MKIEFVSSGEKKELQKLLKENYGIEKVNLLLLRSGKEKLRAYSGILSRAELIELSRILNIELIGTYFGFYKDRELRLSVDACHLLHPTKNIIEISNEDAAKWMKGYDIYIENIREIEAEKGYVIIKNSGNIIGVGKLTEAKILNFL
ncbi:hypothetical protein HZA33_03750, partial [Candidatus Pacearchaeota archaeon]|nr:hypothetical protein [Candidatus Pacearchaeota archaeon]